MWNITVENNEVEINLSVEDQAAATAVLEAIRAEEAATASEASATEATTQAGIATTKANEADQSATTATTAAGTAITAKNASETARDVSIANAEQTALDRIATGEDRVATGLDRVQTGSDRVATGLDVIASQLSESNANTSAILSTEQAILSSTARNEAEGFKIAAEISEENAALSETAAAGSASEATTQAGIATGAANTIAEKIDFTNLSVGDLLRFDGLKMKRVNETDFLQAKIPHHKSPLASSIDLDRLIIWDSFIRPNQTGLGQSDSGHQWGNLGTFPGLNISNNRAVRPSVYQGFAVIENPDLINFKVNATLASVFGASIILALNQENYTEVVFGTSSNTFFQTNVVIDGVTTALNQSTLETGVIGIGHSSAFFRESTFSWVRNLEVDVCFNIPFQIFVIQYRIKELSHRVFWTNLTSYLPTFTSLPYIGIKGGWAGNVCNNFQVFNIQR